MIFSIVTKTRTVVDGQTIESGVTVGTLETNLPIDHVLSAAMFGTFAMVQIGAGATVEKIVEREAVGTDAVVATSKQTKAKVPAADDPDSLNDDDAKADEIAKAESAKAAAKEEAAKADAKTEPAKPTETEVEPDASLEGLDIRTSKALTRSVEGLKTREAIANFVAEGGDLVDIDEIGKAAKAKILAWLES